MATSVSKLLKGLQSPTLINNFGNLKNAARGVQSLASAPQVTALDNGVRVVSQDLQTPTATVGVYVNTGARYETDENNGACHFLEHLAFKGTTKRSQSNLYADLAEIGGEVKANTSREHTSFQTSCLAEGVPKAVDILSDVVLNTKFEDAAIQSVKKAILGELDDIEANDLRSVTCDHLHSVAFQNSDLGKSVFGSSTNVMSMTKETLSNFVKEHYKGRRIVLAAAGGVNHSELVELAKKYLGATSNEHEGSTAGSTFRYTGSEVKVRDDDMPTAHIAIAVEGCASGHADQIPLEVAKVLISSWDQSHGGGTSLASHLARQTAALDSQVLSYEAFNINYQNTGLFGVYFICERMGCNDMTWVLQDEWKRLATSTTNFEVERAKNQLITHILKNEYCTDSTCSYLGQSLLSSGSLIPTNDLIASIKGVTAAKVKDIMFKYIYDQCPVVAAVGPIENQTDYSNVRSGMNWFRL